LQDLAFLQFFGRRESSAPAPLQRGKTNVKHQLQLGFCIGAALLAIVVSGCPSAPVVEAPKATIKGKLTKGGQPLPVNASMGDYAFNQVIFIPAGGGSSFNAKVQADGSFTIETADGKPPPAGKYRVAVRQWEPSPTTDKLGGQFDEQRTKITVEITDPPKDLEIDLDKPQG
jgi:hypothetical protein